jgi:hypothetical protein
MGAMDSGTGSIAAYDLGNRAGRADLIESPGIQCRDGKAVPIRGRSQLPKQVKAAIKAKGPMRKNIRKG